MLLADVFKQMRTRLGELPSGQDEVLAGAIFALASHLSKAAAIPSVPGRQYSELGSVLAELPPQSAGADREVPFWQWMDVAAVAEHCGYSLAADFILGLLQQQLIGKRDAASREWCALCWSRRARVARGEGRYEVAELRYNEALRLCGGRTSEAKYQVLLGLAVMAGIRGNVPMIETHCRTIIHSRNSPAIYRIPAHQMLGMVARKRRQYLDAMLHVWHAYDLLDGEDVRRFEIVGTLAEIALEAGEIDAAENGFRAALVATTATRVIAAAAAGLAEIAISRLGVEGIQPSPATIAESHSLMLANKQFARSDQGGR